VLVSGSRRPPHIFHRHPRQPREALVLELAPRALHPGLRLGFKVAVGAVMIAWFLLDVFLIGK
jgi:hypothetical protein